MPRATRKTKTNSGSEGSAPSNPSTWWNTSALIPSAAPKDSTTVATSKHRSQQRPEQQTPGSAAPPRSTTGMITLLSWFDARCVSSRIAVPPPAIASAPSNGVYGGSHPVHGVLGCLGVRPHPSSCPRGTPARRRLADRLLRRCPGVDDIAVRTAAAWSALLTTTSGLPAPAGKCAATTFSPTTESGVPVKDSSFDRPFASSVSMPSAAAASRTEVVTQVKPRPYGDAAADPAPHTRLGVVVRAVGRP